jgi:ACS family sodium-dependent inorganic phosphate cotransporter-like MFS transporter 5
MLWGVFYCDQPQKSEKVSSVELEKIQRDKNEAQINGSKSIPYKVTFIKLILKHWTFRFWSSIWLYLLFGRPPLQRFFQPISLPSTLRITLKTFWDFLLKKRDTMLRCLGLFKFQFVYSAVNCPTEFSKCRKIAIKSKLDNFRFMSDDLKLIVFNSITVGGAGFVYLLIGFAPTPILGVACLAFVNIVTGAASGGFYKCAVLYSRQPNF